MYLKIELKAQDQIKRKDWVLIMKFVLRGLPEGLVGKSEIEAESVSDAVNKFPMLELFKDDLEKVAGGILPMVNVSKPCDG